MALGAVPIRIDPHGAPEVVWCERLDPARVRIASVPFPESRRACGDVLLTDGEPRGYREYAGRQVPVFNELELLAASKFSTFAVTLSAPDEEAIRPFCRWRRISISRSTTGPLLICSVGRAVRGCLTLTLRIRQNPSGKRIEQLGSRPLIPIGSTGLSQNGVPPTLRGLC